MTWSWPPRPEWWPPYACIPPCKQSINVTKISDPAWCSHIWLGASNSSDHRLRGFCFQDVRAKASCRVSPISVFLIFTKMLKCITDCWDFLDPAREGAFSTLRAWKYDWISHTWEIIQNRLHKSDWANLDFEHLLWFLAFHLFISQYLGRLKSFHLAWCGCALKWMERGRLNGVCEFYFFFVTSQITLFLLTEKKELILKTMKKTRKNKVLCDWQLVSLGAGGSNSGPPCTNMPSTKGLS